MSGHLLLDHLFMCIHIYDMAADWRHYTSYEFVVLKGVEAGC